MKTYLSVLMVAAAAVLCIAQVKDSSELIFNDTVVNDFSISFYYPEWHDSLVVNKNVDESYIPGRVVWHGSNGDSIVLDSVGVRYKGNSSYSMVTNEKKPFKLHFAKYRKNQRFFSLEKLNFSNGVLDPTMMREKVAYDLLKKIIPSPRAAFATLTVGDAVKKAFYTQVEQVDELFLARHFNNDKENLYKAGDDGVSLLYKTANQSDYEKDFELKTNEKQNDWSEFIVMIYQLNNAADKDFVRVVGKMIDLDNCIRYLAFNMVNANFDSYTGSGRNFYLYEDERSEMFKLIPWDLNLSFGAYTYTWGTNMVGVDAFAPSNLDQRPLEQRIFANDSLRRAYAAYMKKLIEGPLSADSVGYIAHRLKPFIDSCVMKDSLKFYTYEQFEANIDTELVYKDGLKTSVIPGLKSFTAKRNENLLLQIEKALPVIKQPAVNGFASEPVLRCDATVFGERLSVSYIVADPQDPVDLMIYSLQGRLLQKVPQGTKRQGTHSADIDIHMLPRGYGIMVMKTGATLVSRNFLRLQ